MFACNSILFSESRLWECNVFTVFALDGFDMLLQALALEGFGKLLSSLGRPWEALASTQYVPPRLSEALGNSGSLWKALGPFASFGMLRQALEGFGMF